MSIRLIASDCDGTLLDDDKKIDAGMSEILPLLRKQGIEFTLATGRNMEIVMPFVKALDLRVPIITNGGAEIYDGERFIVKHALTLNDLLPIIEILEKYRIRSVYYSNDCLYTRYADAVNQYFLNRMNGKVEVKELHDPACLIKMELFKIVIIETDPQLLALVAAFINTLSSTHCLIAEDNLCTITHIQASKGKALMALAERLNIDFDDVAVIGDNHNDLSMFECFANSAAMGNASSVIKEKARYITKDNNHQGVSAFLWRVLKGEVG